MGRRILRLNWELLREALHLPPGTRFVRSSDDPERECINVMIEHPDFVEVPPPCNIPTVAPMLATVIETLTKETVVFEGWR